MKLIDKSALVAEIARQKAQWRICKSSEAKYRREMLDDISSFLDTLEVKDLQEEPVSEELEEAVNAYIGYAPEVDESSSTYGKRQAFRAGAKWQKEKDAILPKVWNRKNLDDFSYQTAYDLSNDWAKETPTWDDVEKACKLGSEWQKKQDQKSMEIMDEVYFKSCDMIRKQIINKDCDWLNTNDSYATPTNVKVEELKKYLEE